VISLAQIIKSQIGKSPEVIAVVLSDASGALLESSGEIDGEAAGAINAVAVRSLNNIGEQLGLGTLKRASLVGPGLSLVLAANDQEIVGLYVDPGKPLGAFEKKLDGVLNR
jgi:predicted regulator of Ras-like GTPase activity (Roadblock/LC7/MglB family)